MFPLVVKRTRGKCPSFLLELRPGGSMVATWVDHPDDETGGRKLHYIKVLKQKKFSKIKKNY